MFRISFVGDILINQEQFKAISNSDNEYRKIFENIKNLFKDSDYLVGNLETPIGSENFTNHKWNFCTPPELLDALKDFGFSLLTTANNHILDRGKDGAIKTMKFLQQKNIDFIGSNLTAERETAYKILETKEGTVAILNYTYGTNALANGHILNKDERYLVNLFSPQEGTNIYNPSFVKRAIRKGLRIIGSPLGEVKWDNKSEYALQIQDDIKKVRQLGALKIFVCMHSGGQYNTAPERWTRSLAKWLINQEVDAVIGHHPHVIHPIKKYRNKYIFYSLGDFTSTPFCDGTPMKWARKNRAGYGLVTHVDIAENCISYKFNVIKSIIGEDGISRIYPIVDNSKEFNNIVKTKKLYL